MFGASFSLVIFSHSQSDVNCYSIQEVPFDEITTHKEPLLSSCLQQNDAICGQPNAFAFSFILILYSRKTGQRDQPDPFALSRSRSRTHDNDCLAFL